MAIYESPAWQGARRHTPTRSAYRPSGTYRRVSPYLGAYSNTATRWPQQHATSSTSVARTGTPTSRANQFMSSYQDVLGLSGSRGLANPIIKPDSPPPPGGDPSGGSASLGSAGGASGLGAAAAVRQYTPVSGGFTPGMGQYNANNEAYLARLRQLEGEYAKRMRWGVTPEQFEYADWGGRDPMVDTARSRIQSELDYSAPFWAQAAQQANRSYDIGREGMLGDRTEDLNAIGLQGQQDFGRLSNMAANMGLNVGQGAIANQYGVMANTAAQQNNVQRDYAQMLAETNAQRQAELGQIRAEEMGMRASAEGRAQTLADELAMQDFDRYMGLRGQAFGEHDSWQNMRMANEQQRLGTLAQQYQGREGLLGAQAGLNQDQRNFTWNDWWRNKDFNYTESWDEINNAYRNQADALARGTDNSRYADAMAQYEEQQRQAAERWAIEQEIYRKQYDLPATTGR